MTAAEFTEKLQEWKTLLAAGAINESEYEQARSKLLAQMQQAQLAGAGGRASAGGLRPPVGTQIATAMPGEILGTQLHAYRVVRSIGRGSYGEVYLACDVGALERLGLDESSPIEAIEAAQAQHPDEEPALVALKLLHYDLTKNEIALAGLRREATRLLKLRHPGVVTVRQWLRNERVADDPRHFIVMEWLQGERLDKSIGARLDGNQTWGLEEAISLIEQIAEPLCYAYEAVDAGSGQALRVVHRDLKPENIMLLTGGTTKARRIKLLDFGIAARARDSGTLSAGTLGALQQAQQQGQATGGGTLGYIAPELTGAATVAPSPRQDCYSLAVLYYRLHAEDARYPYNPQAIRSALDRHQAPEGLAEHPEDDANTKARKAQLRSVLDRALSYDAKARPESAWAFAQALRQALNAPDAECVQAEALAQAEVKVSAQREAAEAAQEGEQAEQVKHRWMPLAIFRDRFKGGVGEGPEMVVIPAGNFLMGSPKSEEGHSTNEDPQTKISFARPFALGRYAVTFAEYDAYCAAKKITLPFDQGWGRGRRPVINVSWEDAKGYCSWLSEQTGEEYHLPSEAQWEYACRAGTTTPFHFGERIIPCEACFDYRPLLKRWQCEWGFVGPRRENPSSTEEVGTLNEPNPWGLHDMHGNVWEWCEDVWNPSLKGQPSDGAARYGRGEGSNQSHRVLRGGSWHDDPLLLRAAYRRLNSPVSRDSSCGFRVARIGAA